jgi:hypothetical protein
LPAALFAAVLMVAVYCVFGSKLAVGENMTVLLAATKVAVPGTSAPPVVTISEKTPAAVTVAGFIASLNVVVILRLIGTLIAPLTGLVEITVGIVPVVKLHTKLFARAVPIASVAPVLIVAVYIELGASGVAGVKVAAVPEYVTVPVTEAPAGPMTVNEEVLIEVGFMALLNVAVIKEVTGTEVAALAGETLTTSGAETGACSRPQPATTRKKRKARIDVVLAAGNLEIITLRMRLLFELYLLNVFWTDV